MPVDGHASLGYDSGTNRITTAGFEYDAAGNQIKAPGPDGNGLLFEYDAAGRISLIRKESDNSLVQAFQYGSTNARLMDTNYGFGYLKLFASTGGTTLAEYTEFTAAVPTWTKSYTYFSSSQLATITPNGQGGEYTEFNHPDRLGTRLVTNQAGGTAYEQVHLPFGTALNAESTLQNNNKRFTSYDRSSVTGLDYAINRTYDSKQGRFTTVDPIGMQAVSLVSPQTLNMYTYCANDPINFTDPMGLFFGKLFKWIGKIFNAVMKVLKWVVVAVIVVTVAIAIIKSGGAASAFLSKILGLVGKILGIKAIATPYIITNLAGTAVGVGWKFSIAIGLSGKLIGALATVGAIANSFQNEKNAPLGPRYSRLYTAARDTIIALLRNPESQCYKFLEKAGFDPEKVAKELESATVYDLNRSNGKDTFGLLNIKDVKAHKPNAATSNEGRTFFTRKGIRSTIVLHEALHRLEPEVSDVDLYVRLGGTKDEYYERGKGSEINDEILANNGCK